MSAPLNTDPAILTKEAGNFHDMSSELTTITGGVNQTAGGLATSWQGAAGSAAQDALMRFNEAASSLQTQLASIADTLHQSGAQYVSTDDDATSAVAQAAANLV